MYLRRTNPDRFQALVNTRSKRMRAWWNGQVGADEKAALLTLDDDDRRTRLATICRTRFLDGGGLNGFADIDLSDKIVVARAVAESIELEIFGDLRVAALLELGEGW